MYACTHGLGAIHLVFGQLLTSSQAMGMSTCAVAASLLSSVSTVVSSMSTTCTMIGFQSRITIITSVSQDFKPDV